AAPAKPPKRLHRTYRPSHKATFIGLAVVGVVLAVNAVIISLVVKSQSKAKDPLSDQVTIDQEALDKLGVNRSPIGESGIQLTIGPNTRFTGKVDVGGSVSVAGQVKVNDELSAPQASLAKLQAGDTTLSKLNVNGDSTLSKLTLRDDLQVSGTSRLHNVTVTGLLTVNNSLNVAGNLGVGGTLAVGKLSTNGLVISGHVVTAGATPGVGRGGCIGSNGTVSISGNDQAGTVAINVGAGACPGTLASIAFRSQYGGTPHVVITPVNRGMNNFYVSRNASGFTIGASSAPSPGGYAFDYIVEQ
ncbi:MAG TPA: hypothetical protein VFX84_02320, partial [Candidatus Saccharimonadales bacterium]|nr:hypothetical protein [Candidatus Saccharimonadales bacterium]